MTQAQFREIKKILAQHQSRSPRLIRSLVKLYEKSNPKPATELVAPPGEKP